MKKVIRNIQVDCPVCSENNCVSLINSEDFFLTKEQFNIVECQNCAIKFTYPRPDPEILQNYYRSPNYISHTNTKKGFIETLYYLIRKLTLKTKIRLIRKFIISGNVLDIGCGTGEFLKETKRQGYYSIGIEPNSRARDIAMKQNGLFVIEEKEIENLPPHIFDIITMWHVLEHFSNLKSSIYQIQKLLKKNGILVIAVPNSDSWDARHYQKYWAAYDLPRHLYHFNQKSLVNLFHRNGFILVNTKPMIFDSFYICLLSEKYKTGKSNFFKAFMNGLYSNFWAMMNHKNFSSKIYIFKVNMTYF
jgi:SAM-dependent methyltransferase